MTATTSMSTPTPQHVAIGTLSRAVGHCTGRGETRKARPPRRDTRFRPGNSAWQARRSPGRRRRFADADALGIACGAYFDWCKATPLVRFEPVKYRGTATVMEVPLLRPVTLAGLCRHLGIGAQTWRDYRRRPAFSWVCEQVESTIRVQQYEGAAAGLFDARIVWRWLAEHQRAGRMV